MELIDKDALLMEIDRQKIGYNVDGKHSIEYDTTRKILIKSYLKYIPNDVKICIGIGSDSAPAHYLLNYDGQLMIHSDCYMQDAIETNIRTVLSFNTEKEE